MEGYDAFDSAEEPGREVFAPPEAPADAEAAEGPVPAPAPPQVPLAVAVSGLYEWRAPQGQPPAPHGPGPLRTVRHEQLRIDVDRYYPLAAASGTLRGGLATAIHWVARLQQRAQNVWAGPIWYKDGAGSNFPYTRVEITVTPSQLPGQRKAVAKFTRTGIPPRVQSFRFRTKYFHPVNFEFDWATGVTPTLEIDTAAHPNRPPALPAETLTIPAVYQRAGFNVTVGSGGLVPFVGSDTLWSDQEMHDAMQVYWSRFANAPQWALWVLFASLHETGTNLGGIMFDDIGPNHRQGTALFVNSFISQAPAGDPNPAAWVKRMIFWTACHEMGHAFNLAHSWQKSLGVGWVPQVDEAEARSFMNYPFLVTGGQQAFFSDFEFRFSPQELLFMRHAPARFVQMGNADWFDHHAFQQLDGADQQFQLSLRVSRDTASFEFMEPVALELKLKNLSGRPQIVDQGTLDDDSVTLIIKKDGREARQYVPFAQRCVAPRPVVLDAEGSIYGAILGSVGLNGWDLAEPGRYTLQAAVHVGGEDIVSAPLALRIEPPATREEEFLAQDLFSEDAGRVLAIGGSRSLEWGNAVLHEIAERLPDRRVALHARYALGNVLRTPYKELVVDPGERRIAIEERPPQADEARSFIEGALGSRPDVAAESFGHIDFRSLVDGFSRWLEEQGDAAGAQQALDTLYRTLSERTVRGRPIRPEVLQSIRERRDAVAAEAAQTT